MNRFISFSFVSILYFVAVVQKVWKKPLPRPDNFNFILAIFREFSSEAILQALRDETITDPRDRIKIAQTHVFYKPSLLGHQR